MQLHNIRIPEDDQNHRFFHKHNMVHHKDHTLLKSFFPPLEFSHNLCLYIKMEPDNMDIDLKNLSF